MRCPRPLTDSRQHGVTLIELIIVISITAIIAGGVAVFISRPFESYVDATRRAELTDIADTALRRMTRDLRSALPNSVRATESPAGSGIYYLEYLQTSGGGRYRSQTTSGGAGDILNFGATDSSFDVIGTMPSFSGGESIVIYNIASSGTTGNAYFGDNRASYSSSAGSTITISPAKQFPFPSPAKRFQVVQYPVTYACNPGTGELRRYWGYAIAAAQPTPPGAGSNALLASSITYCKFTYSESAARSGGVVGLELRVERNGELVRLFQQAHVQNAP
jgi:MSHA biogenesis protein MshO